MAGKHALLIGVSTYGEGLAPIPSAALDVEALQEVLLDPDLGGVSPERLRVLKDPGYTAMASAIESFFANKHAEDLLLLYFSGHGFRDERRQLLLSTAETRKIAREGGTSVQRSTTLAARDVRDYMESSRSTRQVVILDCCFSGAFAEGMAAKDEGTMAIEEMLGGKGRAVLTSSDAIETSRAPESGDGLSVYTRFLVEGIQTGAADRHRRGWLDAEDLHVYAESRVRELAPTMTPQFFPTRDGHSIRVCKVRREPSVAYRRKVLELAEKRGGLISPAGDEILAHLREELALEPGVAERIEAEVMGPFREYKTKLERYRSALRATLNAQPTRVTTLSAEDREELQELERRLKLRPGDVAAIHQELEIREVEIQASAAESTPAIQPSDSAAPALPLISIPTRRGWLVREGNQWRTKTEPITVSGYEVKLAEGVAIKMVKIPAGEFEMGSPMEEQDRDTDEGPQHLVKLESFFLGQTPVTQAQWKVVAGWPKLEVELNPQPSGFNGANRPVERVSWQEAMEFCRRLSQRTQREITLPSEAQWEYACRAGTTTPFAFGETLTPELANYDGTYTYGTGPKGLYSKGTTDVGNFPANAWGVHDMHGNVWEWCLDPWHDNYEGAPTDGTAWADGGSSGAKPLRGGSWFNGPGLCRSAFRVRWPLDNSGNYVGFRLCVSPPGLAS